MKAALHVLKAGPGCTLQDAGRFGWLRYGVTPAGPMDWIGHGTANLLAGNPAGEGALEIGPGGIVLTAETAPVGLGIAADGFAADVDGRPLPGRAALRLAPGERLTIRPGAFGVWAYLAVAGGFAIPPVMGSLSTHLRSGIGPLDGRAVATDQRLPCHAATHARSLALPGATPWPTVLRFIPGPQREAFTGAGFATFCEATFRVGARSDRMGYRLEGPAVAHASGHDIVSDGIVFGAIQVPGDGQPIVLMADRQPTGGYPKIGTVIRADLPALAQARAGTGLRFRAVTVDAAVAALAAATAALGDLPRQAGPMTHGPDRDRLASGDHASGFVNPLDGD
jgi:biotin-dependent carboxylase-like uncharacterized protein